MKTAGVAQVARPPRVKAPDLNVSKLIIWRLRDRGPPPAFCRIKNYALSFRKI